MCDGPFSLQLSQGSGVCTDAELGLGFHAGRANDGVLFQLSRSNLLPMTTHNLTTVVSVRPRRGFTLIEILIVIALIAMLAGAAIVGLNNLFSGGQESVAQTFIDTTGDTALLAYRVNVGSYPTTEQGLAALRSAPEGVKGWKGPYLKKDPVDPWNKPYQYRYPATHNKDADYDLWSFGPDGVESGDDIGNWEK